MVQILKKMATNDIVTTTSGYFVIMIMNFEKNKMLRDIKKTFNGFVGEIKSMFHKERIKIVSKWRFGRFREIN